MLVYFSLLFLSLTFLIIEKCDMRYRHVCAIILMSILTFFLVFRYEVGMDYGEYRNLFLGKAIIYDKGIEPGFVAVCDLVKFIGGKHQLMFLIMGLITSVLIYKSYRKYSPDILFSLFIFLCMGQMYLNTYNAMRQCVAIAFFLYSIRYIISRDTIKYLICIFFASCFHTTAILLTPLYWILPLRIKKLTYAFIFVGITLSSNIIIAVIQNSMYSMYLNFDMYSKEASFSNYIYLIVSSLIFIFSQNLLKNDKNRNIWLNINFCALSLFSLYFVFSGTPIVMIVSRMTYYFIFFYAIIFVKLFSDIRNKYLLRTSYMVSIIVLSLLFLNTTIINGKNYALLPFQFSFQLF